MPENRYLKALGFDAPEDRVSTELSPQGALKWAVSKAPAVLGAMLAKKAYDWAVKKWPNHKRGAEFVGSFAVLIIGYGLAVGASKYLRDSSRMVDRITDGMMGHVGIRF